MSSDDVTRRHRIHVEQVREERRAAVVTAQSLRGEAPQLDDRLLRHVRSQACPVVVHAPGSPRLTSASGGRKQGLRSGNRLAARCRGRHHAKVHDQRVVQHRGHQGGAQGGRQWSSGGDRAARIGCRWERRSCVFNTVFENLTSVLSKIDPPKLNETLGAIASAVNGRGEKIGQMLTDLDAYLAKIEPSLPALSHDLEVAPQVLRAYGDAAPDFVAVADNAARISDTIVDQEQNLDAALVSVTGLADIGNDVIGTNRQPLTDVLHLLVPTTDLLEQVQPGAVVRAQSGMVNASGRPPLKEPGVVVLAGFLWGQERYRYPMDLPKAGATGGPQCTGLPNLPFEAVPPYVVADTGTNPWRRTYPGIVLNSDGLKKILFGEIDGPPRNTYQIGQPG